VPEVCKVLQITELTYFRWWQNHGGMAPEMAKELKTRQQENAFLLWRL
jgi:putative transposase